MIETLYSISDTLAIISLVTGVLFMIAQIFQLKWMWILNIITSCAALMVSFSNHNDGLWAPLWDQILINIYFIISSIVGIVHWKKLAQKEEFHLVKISRKWRFILLATFFFAFGLSWFLFNASDCPSPLFEALALAACFVAATYLTLSCIECWFFWIISDAAGAVVFAQQGQWWMFTLYVCFIISAVAGILVWKKKGSVVEV